MVKNQLEVTNWFYLVKPVRKGVYQCKDAFNLLSYKYWDGFNWYNLHVKDNDLDTFRFPSNYNYKLDVVLNSDWFKWRGLTEQEWEKEMRRCAKVSIIEKILNLFK